MDLVRRIGQWGCAWIVKATWPKSSVYATLYACGHEVSNEWSVAHVSVRRLFSVWWQSTIRRSFAYRARGWSTRPENALVFRGSLASTAALGSFAFISEEITTGAAALSSVT